MPLGNHGLCLHRARTPVVLSITSTSVSLPTSDCSLSYTARRTRNPISSSINGGEGRCGESPPSPLTERNLPSSPIHDRRPQYTLTATSAGGGYKLAVSCIRTKTRPRLDMKAYWVKCRKPFKQYPRI